MMNQPAIKTSPVRFASEVLKTTPVIPQHSQEPYMCEYVIQDNNTSFLVPKTAPWTPPTANPTDDKANLNNITAILEVVSDNVISLNKKVDYLHKKLDSLFEKVDDNKQNKAHIHSKAGKHDMKPLETVEELYNLELKLKTNKEYNNDLIEMLKDVCGENTMKGDNAAYTLVDVIFSRKLMTELSWAGGAKKGSAPKKAFKQFEHVIKFFYTLVKKSDSSYTETEAKNFFKKKVLPNSLRRSIAPMIRASQPKSRNKNLKPKQLSEDEQTNNAHSEDVALTGKNYSFTEATYENLIDDPAVMGVNEEIDSEDIVSKTSTNDYDDGSSGHREDEDTSESEVDEDFVEEFINEEELLSEEFLDETENSDEIILPPLKRMR